MGKFKLGAYYRSIIFQNSSSENQFFQDEHVKIFLSDNFPYSILMRNSN